MSFRSIVTALILFVSPVAAHGGVTVAGVDLGSEDSVSKLAGALVNKLKNTNCLNEAKRGMPVWCNDRVLSDPKCLKVYEEADAKCRKDIAARIDAILKATASPAKPVVKAGSK